MFPEQLYGLATGIGSLPYTGPQIAVDLIMDCFKEIPHWPQLPRRGRAEGMVPQFLPILLDKNIVVADERGVAFCSDHPHWERHLLELYQLLVDGSPDNGEEPFALSPSSAAGFFEFEKRVAKLSGETLCLKGQICGPVTVGFQVTDPQKRPSFYSETLREIINLTLARQAAWQVYRFKRSGLEALLFIDDPAIYGYGSSASVGLGKQEIQSSFKIINGSIRSAGGFSGVHCCAGIDWSLLLELEPDVLSFDAYGYFPSLLVYSEQLDHYLKKGGVLAWGLVPTSPDAYEESAVSLYERLQRGIESLAKKGVDEGRLNRQILITPSCGAGTLSEELAEKIYYLTAEVALRLK